MSGPDYTLEELERQTGVARRTIRFWISRGLLPGPEIAGRNARYGSHHLQRIEEIGRLQREGLTLTEIAAKAEPEQPKPSAEPVAWWQVPVADGVQVWVRGNLAPWHQRAVRRAIAEFEHRLANIKEDVADE